jgi:rare lipoprotein A
LRDKARTVLIIVLLAAAACAPQPRYRTGDTVKVPRYGGSSGDSSGKKPSPKPKGTTVPDRPMIPTGVYEEGIASYYGPKFHGRLTANGEVFDMNGISAAHKVLPFGTMVTVTNLHKGMSIVVRINDRGPFVGDRIIDLSQGAAAKIGMIKTGTARVRLEIVP